LKQLLRPNYIENCIAAIALNCEEPWNAQSSFQHWIDVLMEVLEENMKDLSLDKQDNMKSSSKIIILA